METGPMSKTNFTDGSYLTPNFMNSLYQTGGGHVHDGGSADGHATKIDLTNDVTGPMVVPTDVTVNNVTANTKITANTIDPYTSLAGTLGEAAKIWLKEYVDSIFVNTQVTPIVNGSGTLGTPSAYFASAFINAIYGDVNPTLRSVNVVSKTGCLSTPLLTKINYTIIGPWACLQMDTMYGVHGTTGTFSIVTQSGNWPWGYSATKTPYPCFVVPTSTNSAPTVTDYMPGAFIFSSPTQLDFYYGTPKLSAYGWEMSSGYAGTPYLGATIELT